MHSIYKIYFYLLLCIPSYLLSCPFTSAKKYFKSHKEAVIHRGNKAQTQDIVEHLKSSYSIALSTLRNDLEQDIGPIDSILIELDRFKASDTNLHLSSLFLKVQQCLSILKQETHSKKIYFTWLNLIREILLDIPSFDEKNKGIQFCQHLVLKLSYLHFHIHLNETEVGYSFFQSLILKKYEGFKLKDLRVKEMRGDIEHIFPLYLPEVFKKQMGRWLHYPFYASWDGAKHSLRSKIAQYNWKNHSVSILRMGCPIYKSNLNPKIDPIFEGYLSYIKLTGKKHLYINHQCFEKNGSSFIEKRGSHVLHKLSLDLRFQDHLIFVCLPYDGPFYEQRNLGAIKTDYFIETFRDFLLHSKHGFYIPEQLMDAALDPFFSEMFSEIHSTYFDGQDFLECHQRRQFIDIAYAYLAQFFIETCKVSSVNWSCRHGIDRAMSSVTIFESFIKSKSCSTLDLNSIFYLSLWPAFTYYHRATDLIRFNRMFSTLYKMEEILNVTHTRRDLNSTFYILNPLKP